MMRSYSATRINDMFHQGLAIRTKAVENKSCALCKTNIRGASNLCLECQAKTYTNIADKKRKPDSYLDKCERCRGRTMHLGPGLCVWCSALPAGNFYAICVDCDVQTKYPSKVKDGSGGEVDLITSDIDLWCSKCSKLADTYLRLHDQGPLCKDKE